MYKKSGIIYVFLVIGIAVFAGYQLSGGNVLLFTLIGPSIYFAHAIKHFAIITLGLSGLLQPASVSFVNDYIFLMPATILYFGVIGFQIQQLIKERGFIRHLSIFALLAFLGYLHYQAWVSLTGYLLPNA